MTVAKGDLVDEFPTIGGKLEAGHNISDGGGGVPRVKGDPNSRRCAHQHMGLWNHVRDAAKAFMQIATFHIVEHIDAAWSGNLAARLKIQHDMVVVVIPVDEREIERP